MFTLTGKKITQNGLGLSRKTSSPPCSIRRLGAHFSPGMTRASDPLSDEQSFKILKAAVEADVVVWNGADFYGTPENNSLHLINRYFTAHPEDADRVVVCIKSGLIDMKTHTMDCSPEAMRRSVQNAILALDGKKKLDVFGPARVDPNVPIEDTVMALAQLVDEGKIGGIQLSEVTAPTIQRAANAARIAMVECEVSLWSTDIFANGVAELCSSLKIPVVAHSPLGGGILTGRMTSLDDMRPQDHHRFFPRFQPDAFAENIKLVRALGEFADKKKCSMSQLALCWVRAQTLRPDMPFLVTTPGASSGERLVQNCEDVGLSVGDLLEIKKIQDEFPVVGDRYPPAGMKLIQ